MHSTQSLSFSKWVHAIICLIVEVIPNHFFPDRWVAKVLATGVQVTGEVVANSYVPGLWSYSGPSKYVDVQVLLDTPQPQALLVRCRIGQAIPLAPNTRVIVKYNPLQPQQAIYVTTIDPSNTDANETSSQTMNR